MSAEVVNLTPSLASDLPSKSIVASEIRSRITTGRLPLGDLTIEDVGEICAMRAILEAGAIRLAAEKGSAELMGRLGLLVGRAAIALGDGDLALCDELDCQFHEGIVEASANSYLIQAYSGISDKLRALRHRLSREPSRMARAIAQHRHIVDLWAAGRVDQATVEISSHVSNVARLLAAIQSAEASIA
jgi:DNA-binding GntR family transcriptional regulator